MGKALTLGLAVILFSPISSQAQLVNQYTPCSTVLWVASMPTGEGVPITQVVLCLVKELRDSQDEIDELQRKVQQLQSDKEALETNLQQLETNLQQLEADKQDLENEVSALQLQMSTVQNAVH